MGCVAMESIPASAPSDAPAEGTGGCEPARVVLRFAMNNIAYANVRIAYAMLYVAWMDMRLRRARARLPLPRRSGLEASRQGAGLPVRV